MEWEEPHDSTLYCLQTDGNHLLATGSSYYGVVRLWDRRQRACLHVSVPTSTRLWGGKTHGGQGCAYGPCPCSTGSGTPKLGQPIPNWNALLILCPPLQAFPLTSTPLSSPVYCLRFTTRHLYAALSYNLHILDFQNP